MGADRLEPTSGIHVRQEHSDPHRENADLGGWRCRAAARADLLTAPFRLLLNAAVLCREAVPIGLLRRHEILAVVDKAYRNVPDFYHPDRYPNDYELQLLPLLQKHVVGDRLLDLYCGHGREAKLFSQAGYRLLGVDRLEPVIQRATAFAGEKGFSAEFLAADIDRWEPNDKDWDVVYTSLWMYSTIPDRTARRAWLYRLGQWCSAEGLLVFSTTPGGRTAGARLRHLIARSLSLITLNARIPEIGDRFHTGLFWHDLTAREVTEDIEHAGLRLVDRLSIEDGTPCDFYLVGHAPKVQE